MTQAPPPPPPASPPPPPATRGPERFAAPVAAAPTTPWTKVLGAAVALLVLVVGVPVLMWVFTGPPPFPDGFPGRDELTSPIDTDTLLAVLRAVVWLAWLQFAICTVVEVMAALRGGQLARPLPLSGPSQGLARALVGTLLIGSTLLGAVGTGSAASATSPEPGDSRPEAAPTSAVVAQQVRESIAESVQATADVEQAPRHQAGDHVPGVPPSMTDVVGKKVVVVQPPDGHYHDNLWDIAERHLGDGRRWQEVYDLNKGRDQPDGGELVIGRLIQPGWVLVMPDDAVDAPRVGAVAAIATTQQSADLDKAGPQQGRNTPVTATGVAAEAGVASVADSSWDEPAPAADESDATEQAADRASSDDGWAVEEFVGGGLLAAMLAAAVAAERRRRRTRLEHAHRETEVVLRAGADPGRVDRIDRALRSLSAHCRVHRVPLPQIYAATVDDTRLDLRIAPPLDTAPAPWVVLDGGSTWRLPAEAELPDDRGHAPYPGLVCFGRGDDGADVLVDLEAVGGVLALSGSAHVARQVVSAIAAQLATVPWADAQVVHGYDLPAALGPVAGDVLRPVADLGAMVSGWAASPPGRPAQEVLGGRLGRRPGVQPQYLLLGSLPDDTARDAVGALGAGGTRGVGIVSAMPVPGARWRVHVDDTGRLTIPLLDIDVRAVRLTDPTVESLADLFGRARSEAVTVDGPRAAVPDPLRSGSDTEWRLAEIAVGVLGPAVVRAPGPIDPARVEIATEIVTFLALQDAPVHPSVLGASIWPRGVTPEVRDATIERVRTWLGTVDGAHALGQDEEGRLFLAEAVRVDWYAFCTLLQESRGAGVADERELVARALRLVRGRLLEGHPGHRYSWLPRTSIDDLSAMMVVDAAHRLAVLSFDDDPEGAAAASRAGLRLAPESQVLWRDLLVAEFRREEGAGAAAAVEEMVTELDRHGVPLDAETEALVHDLLPESDLAGSS
ncbi:bacterial transcriptional activator domain-containing protein [Nocardioides sp. C4-1]|uniref:bacterial transcriptional activator domain-containing protein n=1 Tax=Nocardioides sp. C4-1 TaxID=3151851 RepID=UPI00326601A4